MRCPSSSMCRRKYVCAESRFRRAADRKIPVQGWPRRRRAGVSAAACCRLWPECRSWRTTGGPSMIRVLSNVLEPAELRQIGTLLPRVAFADGRITNRESTVKQNLQAQQEDPANAEIAQIARVALFHNPVL